MMGEFYMRRLPVEDDGSVMLHYDAVGKGMIARERNGDVHVNRVALKDESVRVLRTDDRVRYELMQGAIAPRATNAHKTSAPEPIIEEFPVVSDSAAGSFFG